MWKFLQFVLTTQIKDRDKMINYYELLGVSRSSSIEEIKAAYRKKAQEYHPDKNNSKYAHDEFLLVQESYSILSDKLKKEKYDAILQNLQKKASESHAEREKSKASQTYTSSKSQENTKQSQPIDYVLKSVAKYNRKIITKLSICSVLFILFLVLFGGDLSNYIFNPNKISENSLLSIDNTSIPSHNYVEINYGKPFNEAIVELIDGTKMFRYSNYVKGLIVNKKLFFVVVSDKDTEVSLPLKGTIKLADYRIHSVLKEEGFYSNNTDAFSPVMIDTTSRNWTIFFDIGILLTIVFFTCKYIYQLYRYSTDQATHPIYKNLVLYNFSRDQINQLINEAVFNIGSVYISDDYIIFLDTMDICHLSRVNWAYHYKLSKRTNGIPTGTEHSLIIVFDTFKATFKLRKSYVIGTLNYLSAKYPHIILGYTKDIDNVFKNNNKEFVNYCNMRKSN